MNSKVFYMKVKRMREAQRRYFRTRSEKALSDARRIEQEIDAEIERVEAILRQQQRVTDLFGDDCE